MGGELFVVSNQLGQYWTRAGEWVDGREPQRVLKHRHRDEAVNLLVELSAKDFELRGQVQTCEADAKGELQLEASEHLTPTLAERAAAQAAAAEAAEEEAAADAEEADGEVIEDSSAA